MHNLMLFFRVGDQWQCTGVRSAGRFIQSILQDVELLRHWARNAGCHSVETARIRVVEVGEQVQLPRGTVRRNFLTRPGVRTLRPTELRLGVPHLQPEGDEFLFISPGP